MTLNDLIAKYTARYEYLQAEFERNLDAGLTHGAGWIQGRSLEVAEVLSDLQTLAASRQPEEEPK